MRRPHINFVVTVSAAVFLLLGCGYANVAYAAVKLSGATDAFGYDGPGNWTTYTNAEGRVYRMSYDALGRVTAATNAAISETYLYDGNGALTNLVSGSNAVFSAAYDPLGQLASLRLCVKLPPAARV